MEMLDLVEYGEQTVGQPAKGTATRIKNQRASAGTPSGRDTQRLARDPSRGTASCAVEIFRSRRAGSQHYTLPLANGPPQQITWMPVRHLLGGHSVA
jgi:hypothetical protein